MSKFLFSNPNFKLTVFLAFFLISGTAFSQKALAPLDEWAVQVYNQFRLYEQQMTLTNQSHEIVTGFLEDDSETWINIELPGGYTYFVLGVCDNDCIDLDLGLYSQAGELLSEDVETDDYPLVGVSVAEKAIYRVKVVMADCSTAPCRYGLGVYRQE